MTNKVSFVSLDNGFKDPDQNKIRKHWMEDRRDALADIAELDTPVLVINEESINEAAFNLLNIKNISSVLTDVSANSDKNVLNRLNLLKTDFYCNGLNDLKSLKAVLPDILNYRIVLNISAGSDCKKIPEDCAVAFEIYNTEKFDAIKNTNCQKLYSISLDCSDIDALPNKIGQIKFLHNPQADFGILLKLDNNNNLEHSLWIKELEDILYDIIYDFPNINFTILNSDYLLAGSGAILCRVTDVSTENGRQLIKVNLKNQLLPDLQILHSEIVCLSRKSADGHIMSRFMFEDDSQLHKQTSPPASVGDIILIPHAGIVQGVDIKYLKSRRVCTVCGL